MAERLAPENVPMLMSSCPERLGCRRRRWPRRLVQLVLVLVVLLLGAVVTAHLLAVQPGATSIRATALIPEGLPARVLVLLARPGQELPMAGTLAELDRAGASVTVLVLTAGEAQPPHMRSADDEIAGIRAEEIARSADILGATRVSTARFADGSLLETDPGQVSGAIAESIHADSPSVILTVSDRTGQDTDSQVVSTYALTAAGTAGSGVARVWTVTRGDREVSWNAMLGAPVGEASRTPRPQVSVRIDDEIRTKGEVLMAHGTQSPDLLRETYPYADTIPAWAYLRFWDREYFALAWGQPLR